MTAPVRLERFEQPPFGTNTYLALPEGREEAWVVDPSGNPQEVLARVAALEREVTRIVLTHGHLDHWLGAHAIQQATGAPAWLDSRDHFLLDERAGGLFGLGPTPTPTVEEMPTEPLRLPGGATWETPHTPGHSPGHRILVGEGHAVVGDLVFMGSIGRMDLPGGDPQAMRASLEAIRALPPAYDLFPGHGPPTTVARELADNPYLQEGSRWI